VVKFITGPFTSSVYEFDGSNNNDDGAHTSRRYYDDITISEVQDGNEPMIVGSPKKILDDINEENPSNGMDEILEEIKMSTLDARLPSYSEA